MTYIKMRYSIESRIYVKGCGLLSFAKNMGTHLNNKDNQKLLDGAKKFTTDAIKTASKKAIQKAAETTGELTGNKIADKITSASKSSNKLYSQNNLDETDTSKERYISPKKRQQLIDELRLT